MSMDSSIQAKKAGVFSMVLLEPSRSKGAFEHLHYDTFMERSLCSVAILTDFLAIDESGFCPGLRHPPTRG